MRPKKLSVFDLLDKIRHRPDMYVHNRSLEELEMMLWGYQYALRQHRVLEDAPRMGLDFAFWLEHRTGWSMCCGYARGIAQHVRDNRKAFDKLFEFVDEYRRLRPTTVCTVRLRARHVPTGKRVVIGMNGRMEKPRRVDIVRYSPAPFYRLRFHYGDRIDEGDLLRSEKGLQVSLRLAKRWVHDELQVEYDAWEKPAR